MHDRLIDIFGPSLCVRGLGAGGRPLALDGPALRIAEKLPDGAVIYASEIVELMKPYRIPLDATEARRPLVERGIRPRVAREPSVGDVPHRAAHANIAGDGGA